MTQFERWNIHLANNKEISADNLFLAAGRYAFPFEQPNDVKLKQQWFGWNATFSGVNQSPGEMSIHFYPFGYVGVLTFKNGETNVCGLSLKKNKNPLKWDDIFHEAISSQIYFKNLMKNSERTTEWRGVGPLPFCRKRNNPYKELILLGDSAAVGNPFMGEGNARALSSGPLLYSAFTNNISNKKQAYQNQWQKKYQTRLFLGEIIRPLLGVPSFSKAVLSQIGNLIPEDKLLSLFHE